MKKEHLKRQIPWSEHLMVAIRDAVRSCVRGIGADRQCMALNLERLAGVPDPTPVPDGPSSPMDTVLLFAMFACREMEAAVRLVRHLQIKEGKGCGVVALYLPASKTDVKGEGVLRRHGCLCSTAPDLCPVAAGQRLLKAAAAAGHGPDDPLLVTDQPKTPPTKTGMIATFRQVASAIGYDEESVKGLTGHVLRPTGAQFMARLGVEYYKIQLFCRWGSDTILRYLREVPLEGSAQWLSQSMSVEEVVTHTTNLLKVDENEGAREAVTKAVQDALEAVSSELHHKAEAARDEIDGVLAALKEKSIAMEDRWADELSRRFLPRFVLNTSSSIVHAVKDAFTTGCGKEFRNTTEFLFLNEAPDPHTSSNRLCEGAGCLKILDQQAKAL